VLVLDFMSISTLGRCFYIYVYNPKREKRKEKREKREQKVRMKGVILWLWVGYGLWNRIDVVCC